MCLGVILGRAKNSADLLNPFIMAFHSLPKIALGPLLIIWFGIGMDMKIILTAVVVFFLVFLNTYTGVRGVSQELVAILRLMGANERLSEKGRIALGCCMGFCRAASVGALRRYRRNCGRNDRIDRGLDIFLRIPRVVRYRRCLCRDLCDCHSLFNP